MGLKSKPRVGRPDDPLFEAVVSPRRRDTLTPREYDLPPVTGPEDDSETGSRDVLPDRSGLCPDRNEMVQVRRRL